MPIYEFKCLNCGKLFEKIILKKEEETNLRCPHCNSQNIKKILSSFHSTQNFSSKVPSCSSKFGFT